MEISKHKVYGGSYVVTLEAFGHALNSGLLMEEEADSLVQCMEGELGTEDKANGEQEAFLDTVERFMAELIDVLSYTDGNTAPEPKRELLTPEYIHGWMEAHKEEDPICKLYDFLQLHDMAEEAELAEDYWNETVVTNSTPFFKASGWQGGTVKLLTRYEVSYIPLEKAAFEIAKMYGRAYDRD